MSTTDADSATYRALVETEKPSKSFLYFITAFGALGGFLFGYDTGVVSGALLFLKKDFDLNDEEQELVVSLALLGAMAGAVLCGRISDRYGRKPTILLASWLFSGGAVIMAVATSLGTLLVGRAIVGVGVGIASCVVPVYISEVAPPEQRGALVTVNNLFITGGQFVSYVVDALLAPVDEGWRWMFGLSAVPAVIQIMMTFSAPETPRWLISRGRVDEGRVVLRKIFDKEDVEDVVSEIQLSLHTDTSTSEAWRRVLSPEMRRALILGVGLQVYQQFCGINTAMYYSPTILKTAGFGSDEDSIYFSIAIAGCNAIATIFAIRLIEQLGRRTLLLRSLLGVCAGLFLIGVSFFLMDFWFGKWVSLFSLVFYISFFGVGMGEMPWVINSEIYPLQVRGVATSIATAANWISNFIVSSTILTLFSAITPGGTFILYGSIAVTAWIFVYANLPETKDKTLEEVEDTLKNWVNPLSKAAKLESNTAATSKHKVETVA
eukprot:GFYU01000425.1.p1 GENE.GFYU01000425.1~~GFYU01000425.1.p1  ORF type:complete len:492 (-),score=160.63 GFYU01000425.1:108-1583(-)